MDLVWISVICAILGGGIVSADQWHVGRSQVQLVLVRHHATQKVQQVPSWPLCTDGHTSQAERSTFGIDVDVYISARSPDNSSNCTPCCRLDRLVWP